MKWEDRLFGFIKNTKINDSKKKKKKSISKFHTYLFVSIFLANLHMDNNEPQESSFWVPLESNPAALTKFAHGLGVKPNWVFTDCIGLDEELLAMSPQPVIALVFLFPYSKMLQFREEERSKIEKAPQNISPKVYYMKQLVGNACGTVAMVHCIANNRDQLGIDENSFFSKFLEKTKQVNPEERGKLFGAEKPLAELSDNAAKDESTQTEAPAADANVDSHFVCFTEVDGHLYERES